MKNLRLFILLIVLLASCTTEGTTQATSDELSLWNDSKVKTAITDFVATVTDKNSTDFVPREERIAVFDNDGTLWCEKPLSIPVELELTYIKNEYPRHLEWSDDELFSGIANNDLSVLSKYTISELFAKFYAAQAGMKEQDYKDFVYHTLSTQMHSKFKHPLKETTFAPMVQLVHFLQANNFKVYIVTGGEISSVRTISEEIYTIPKENVVGTSVVWEYTSDENDALLIRTAVTNSVNDKQTKPINIELHIGRKPIFAAGNSDGDYQMMGYTLSNKKPSMAILVHHDDENREYSYTQGAEKALEDAVKKGWYVVSMKDNFKTIFAD